MNNKIQLTLQRGAGQHGSKIYKFIVLKKFNRNSFSINATLQTAEPIQYSENDFFVYRT